MKRALILARQSLKKSPDSVSIPEQIAGMQRYCVEKGYAVVGVIQSENVRGTRERERRADLTEIEMRADAGEFDVLLVWKLDRLARYLRVQENVIYELERHDVTLESTTEPIVNSVMGRQVLGMMAEQFSRDLSQRLTAVVGAHVRMGKHQGKAPIGFVRGDDDRLQVDPDTADAMRALFTWRLEGAGAIVMQRRLLAEYGIRIAPKTILYLLANPVYRGAVTGPNGLVVEGAHEPLVDAATFDAVQRSLDKRRASRAKQSYSWLEGLLMCGCGRPMYLCASDNQVGRYWKFRCRGTLEHIRCPEPQHSISQRKAEQAALALLEAALSRMATMNAEQWVTKMERQRTRQFPGWQRRQADLAAKIKKAKQRQDAINEARLDHRMTRDEANRRYRQLDAEIADGEKELAAGPRPVDPQAVVAMHAVAAQLIAADLSDLTFSHPDVIRAFLRQAGAQIVFKDGEIVLEGLV